MLLVNPIVLNASLGATIDVGFVAGALLWGVIIPTRIQQLLLVICIVADLLLEGILPVLEGTALCDNSQTTKAC